MKKEQLKPYATPAYRLIGLLVEDVICASENRPGQDSPWDPRDEDQI